MLSLLPFAGNHHAQGELCTCGPCGADPRHFKPGPGASATVWLRIWVGGIFIKVPLYYPSSAKSFQKMLCLTCCESYILCLAKVLTPLFQSSFWVTFLNKVRILPWRLTTPGVHCLSIPWIPWIQCLSLAAQWYAALASENACSTFAGQHSGLAVKRGTAWVGPHEYYI